jgi:hypothetical protein
VRRALIAWTSIVATVALAAPALAAAVNELAKARAEYARSQYQRTVDLLVPVLNDPRQIADLTDEDAIEAHKLLGLSYFFLSQTARVDDRPRMLESAGIQFASLLFIDPDYVLDAAVEGPEAVQYFDAIKRDQSQQLAKIREQKRLDEERKTRPQRERVVLTVVHDPSAWENFVPFGYPQFANGQTEKGAILLGIQGVAFGTSAFFYLQQAFKYGWPVGRLPSNPDEVSTIRTEQYIQIGAGALFFAAYAFGVYDGFKHQRPSRITSEDIRPIRYPDHDKDDDKGDDKKSSLQLVPLITDDAWGLGVTWER